MRFDHYEDDAAVALLPDGTNELEITKVKTVTRKADGRSVTVVTLADVGGTYQSVDRWLDPQEKRDCQLAVKLLAALGLPREHEIDGDLIGRRVKAITQQGQKKTTGEWTVYVNGFEPGPAFEQFNDAPPKPAAAPPKRTATQKADAASATIPNDDIPF